MQIGKSISEEKKKAKILSQTWIKCTGKKFGNKTRFDQKWREYKTKKKESTDNNYYHIFEKEKMNAKIKHENFYENPDDDKSMEDPASADDMSWDDDSSEAIREFIDNGTWNEYLVLLSNLPNEDQLYMRADKKSALLQEIERLEIVTKQKQEKRKRTRSYNPSFKWSDESDSDTESNESGKKIKKNAKRSSILSYPELIIIINISYFKCSSMNHTSRGSKETLALLKLRTYAFNFN